ncbi:hypothetical protein ACFLVX_03625 [Chloroflexota bacterium]
MRRLEDDDEDNNRTTGVVFAVDSSRLCPRDCACFTIKFAHTTCYCTSTTPTTAFHYRPIIAD